MTYCAHYFFQVTESIEVTVGDAPPISVSSTADWAESLHECSLPSAALPEGEVTVKVKVQKLEATVTLRGELCKGVCVCGGGGGGGGGRY